MMIEIVKRLYEHAEQAHESGSLGWRDTMTEAADRITALEAEVNDCKGAIDYLTADYNRCCDEKEALEAEGERKDRMLVIAGRVITGKITLAEADAEARAALTPTQEKQG